MRVPSLRWVLMVGSAVAGCSSAALLYTAHEPPRAQRPPNVTVVAGVSSGATKAPDPIVLDQFTPLLAEAPFRAVAEALELGDARRAAEALQQTLEAQPALRSPTTDLWSGRLWERASENARAHAACARAHAPGALLGEYAELCAARSLLAAARPRDAVARLRGRSFAPAVEGERRLLVARAARASGDKAQAVAALREALAERKDGPGAARIRLDLAELLLELSVPPASPGVEPLELARSAFTALAGFKSDRQRAEELEQRALLRLSAEEQKQHALPGVGQRLARLSALVDARDHGAADKASAELIASLSAAERAGETGCEAQLLRAKALAGMRQFGPAADALNDAREHCNGNTDRGARIWFLSGRYAASAGRYVQATSFFGELERRHPTHSLTDDARFYAAIAQQELGVEARFTELLMSLPEDYPGGDMAAEGLFRLALRRMERGTWADALGLLERGIRHIGDQDGERGLDLSGRERYFRARALLATGERDEALVELSTVIQRFPLSYYMAQSYSLLERLEPGQGERAVAMALESAAREPFRVAGRRELSDPGFLRMMELLRIGELDAAVTELDGLGLRKEGTGSEILWGIALLYERAGFSKFSADLAKRRLSEVVRRWPVSGWERAWQIAFPRPHLPIVLRETTATRVDPALVYAVMREESAFDPEVVSHANAYGLMQLIVPTARLIGAPLNLPWSPDALKRPRVNVALGCRALAQMAANFEHNPLLAIPAYNAGPGRARRWVRERPSTDFDLWVELIPYHETRRYTKRVLSARAVYAFLYEPEQSRSRWLLPRQAYAGAPP